jgi:tripartite-type tricarboxylate transporter receptor subunit TctC
MGRIAFAAFAACLALAAAAQSPGYPNHPVKILVPYGPGGVTDIIARQLAPRLEQALGQPFVVENRPGASGNLALEAAAKAEPDGYTLLIGNVSTNTINETTFAQTLHIKPSRDLVGISKLVETPHVVIAAPAFPPNNIAELVAWAKKNPGKLNYASAGIGSYPHLDMLRFCKAAGIEGFHVPYKGGAGQMATAVMTNEVQVSFINLASTGELIKAGKLKALAVTTAERQPQLPNVPTMAEQGYPGIGTNAWQGMFAPAGTPPAIVEKLHDTVAAILNKPELRDMLAAQLMTVAVSPSSREFNEQVRAETREWGDFVRVNQVKIE